MGELIKGPWPEETHLQVHQRLFENLLELMSDFNDTIPTESPLPTTKNDDLDWTKIPINFLLQYAAINIQKVTHEHVSVDIPTKETTDEVPI